MISQHHQAEILRLYDELARDMGECDAAMTTILERIKSAERELAKVNALLRPYGLTLHQISGIRFQQPTHMSAAVFGRISHVLIGSSASASCLSATQLKHDESMCANAEHDRRQLEQTFTYLAERAELTNRH